LLNIQNEDDRLLVKVKILSLFIPDIAHPILDLHGDQGSGKTTGYRLIKRLVDPSRPELLTLHKDRNEFIQQLSHNYVAFYDNVKHVPSWLSDEACKAVTGIGHTKRALYTNDDDVVYEFKRPLGFNGINISLSEPDALDRTLLIRLERIPRNRRKTDSEVLEEFDLLLPGLLGFIFDTLSKALSIKPTIQLIECPRMAEFAHWGEAIAQALGYPPMQFLRAYLANIGVQNAEVIESHPLGQAIFRLMKQLEPEYLFVGSPKELLERLNRIAEENKIDINHHHWPKSVNSLPRKLNQIKSNLLEGLGIEATVTRDSRSNLSVVQIRKVSPEPPVSPGSENTKYAGASRGSGDTGDSFHDRSDE
jgi:hypothetical protein